jgi:hypothetical protein
LIGCLPNPAVQDRVGSGSQSASGTGINRQLGHFESNAIVAKTLDEGVHVSAGYGFDNEKRQVFYMQFTVYF